VSAAAAAMVMSPRCMFSLPPVRLVVCVVV
jgi:hypothetical protein